MMFELEIDVPTNRKVTLPLPPEVPLGRVTLHVAWEVESLPEPVFVGVAAGDREGITLDGPSGRLEISGS